MAKDSAPQKRKASFSYQSMGPPPKRAKKGNQQPQETIPAKAHSQSTNPPSNSSTSKTTTSQPELVQSPVRASMDSSKAKAKHAVAMLGKELEHRAAVQQSTIANPSSKDDTNLANLMRKFGFKSDFTNSLAILRDDVQELKKRMPEGFDELLDQLREIGIVADDDSIITEPKKSEVQQAEEEEGVLSNKIDAHYHVSHNKYRVYKGRLVMALHCTKRRQAKDTFADRRDFLARLAGRNYLTHLADGSAFIHAAEDFVKQAVPAAFPSATGSYTTQFSSSTHVNPSALTHAQLASAYHALAAEHLRTKALLKALVYGVTGYVVLSTTPAAHLSPAAFQETMANDAAEGLVSVDAALASMKPGGLALPDGTRMSCGNAFEALSAISTGEPEDEDKNNDDDDDDDDDDRSPRPFHKKTLVYGKIEHVKEWHVFLQKRTKGELERLVRLGRERRWQN